MLNFHKIPILKVSFRRTEYFPQISDNAQYLICLEIAINSVQSVFYCNFKMANIFQAYTNDSYKWNGYPMRIIDGSKYLDNMNSY
jgi:hypothetical protein